MSSAEGLEVVQWNCRNLRNNKTPLHQYLLNRHFLPHFLLIQEARATSAITGYRAYHAATSMPLTSIYGCCDMPVELLDIPCTHLKYLVGVVYYDRSSKISLALLSFYNPACNFLFIQCARQVPSLTSVPTTNLILGGDFFNAPHTLWGYPQTLKPGRLLHCLVQERHLTLPNTPGSPTRAGTTSQRPTAPDLTFSRRAPFSSVAGHSRKPPSDLFLIHVSISVSHIPRRRLVTHIDWDAFRTALASHSFESYENWTSGIAAALSSSSHRARIRHPIHTLTLTFSVYVAGVNECSAPSAPNPKILSSLPESLLYETRLLPTALPSNILNGVLSATILTLLCTHDRHGLFLNLS
ncbi:hypothetical protein HPB48_026799 [Haemaphysalis longicornis]|uniref:Endonuclease/exonuclease/phosphatase domain-containing protein n=1 Tax=Haemaphysalis longicornis TaxID=44386 RepID=A0A9J6HCR7_HAELO|nr:hypothetical protein HPB48_026799 [Haemaphysalis longicornis]